MCIRRYEPEQIVNLLRQIEVRIANGKPTPQACKEAEITVQTYYRWRKGMATCLRNSRTPTLIVVTVRLLMYTRVYNRCGIKQKILGLVEDCR